MKIKILSIFLIILCFQVKSQTIGQIIDLRDGKSYKTVQIGDQTWFAENLAYLTKVTSPKSEYGGYWVYDYYGTDIEEAKKTENYKNYGVLYNWYSASKSCPAGWHLPSTDEWIKLITFAGGFNETGNKFKETDTLL